MEAAGNVLEAEVGSDRRAMVDVVHEDTASVLGTERYRADTAGRATSEGYVRGPSYDLVDPRKAEASPKPKADRS